MSDNLEDCWEKLPSTCEVQCKYCHIRLSYVLVYENHMVHAKDCVWEQQKFSQRIIDERLQTHEMLIEFVTSNAFSEMASLIRAEEEAFEQIKEAE